MEEIRIIPFKEEHIAKKVEWYNDEEISKYLHYKDKFTIEGTKKWLERIKQDDTRLENVIQILENGEYINIGIIGLFNIDRENKKAGFYITIGEKQYQGKGYAKKATKLFIENSFKNLELEKIYLYTDFENEKAIKLYEKCGFQLEGKLKKELFYKNRFINRYYYAIFREDVLGEKEWK